MRRVIVLVALNIALLGVAPAFSAGTPSPQNAMVYIIWPSDGAVIHGGKFWLRMGLRDMGVAPKGTNMPNVGHHHVLVDTELPAFDQPIRQKSSPFRGRRDRGAH
jgi:hypothetical protein